MTGHNVRIVLGVSFTLAVIAGVLAALILAQLSRLARQEAAP